MHALDAAEERRAEAKTILTDGSYCIGPRELPLDGSTVRTEFCLVKARRERARIVHVLKRRGDSRVWALAEVEVHFEQWEAPGTAAGAALAQLWTVASDGPDGALGAQIHHFSRFGPTCCRELAACGFGMAAFAEKPRVSTADLEGSWQVTAGRPTV